MRQQTWFACIICILGVLPGMLVGTLASFIYRLSVGWTIGFEPDFFMLRTFFGVETPGLVIKWVFFQAIPIGIHGGVAGAVAVMLTGWICKGAKIDIAAYACGALYSGVVILMLILVVLTDTVSLKAVEAFVQLIGLWIGLVSAMASIYENQQPTMSRA